MFLLSEGDQEAAVLDLNGVYVVLDGGNRAIDMISLFRLVFFTSHSFLLSFHTVNVSLDRLKLPFYPAFRLILCPT